MTSKRDSAEKLILDCLHWELNLKTIFLTKKVRKILKLSEPKWMNSQRLVEK